MSGGLSQWSCRCITVVVWGHTTRTTPHGDRRPPTRLEVLEDPGPWSETEHEQHAALRGPMPPPPGAPSLAAPLLAGQEAEGIDPSSLRFLAAAALLAVAALAARRKQEEERRKRGGVEAGEGGGGGEEEGGEGEGRGAGLELDAGKGSAGGAAAITCFVLDAPEKEKEEEEEEAASSSWHAAPGCLRQGYWFSRRVVVMHVRRLRQA